MRGSDSNEELVYAAAVIVGLPNRFRARAGDHICFETPGGGGGEVKTGRILKDNGRTVTVRVAEWNVLTLQQPAVQSYELVHRNYEVKKSNVFLPLPPQLLPEVAIKYPSGISVKGFIGEYSLSGKLLFHPYSLLREPRVISLSHVPAKFVNSVREALNRAVMEAD